MKKRLNTKLISTLHSVLYMPVAEVRAAAGITRSTWYELMAKPETITVQQLLGIANGLHIPVSRFFSSGRADLIGKRDDYVTEPYVQCRYDNEALRQIVCTRPDTTWKRAAEITGMTYQHLQKSLMAQTRTPVARLLTVCHTFDIDLSTILVDGNPVKSKGKKRQTEEDVLRKEVNSLRDDVRALASTVQELKEMYERLLSDHDQLTRRIGVNIENVNSSYIGIAADSLQEDK